MTYQLERKPESCRACATRSKPAAKPRRGPGARRAPDDSPGAWPRLQGAPPATSAPAQPIAPDPFATLDAKSSAPYELSRPEKKTVCEGSMTLNLTPGAPGEAHGNVEARISSKGKQKVSGPGTSYLFARGERMKEDGKRCFCDCMSYRQQIRPWAYTQDQGQGWLAYDRITSARGYVPTGVWSEEDMHTTQQHLDDSARYGCKRGPYIDHPGMTTQPPPGISVLLRYNMRFLLWDSCQQRVIKEEQWTLDVTGTAPNFTTTWTAGWQGAPRAPAGAQPHKYEDPVLDPK